MDHTDGMSSAKMETGGIITPTAPSVASYSFVPPIHFTETNKELRSPVITRSLDVSVSPTKSPKSLPTDSFYSRIGRFPFQIKQMTYSSDDITNSRKLRNDDAKQAILNTARSEPYDPLNKDIVQQVNHWMRNKPLSDSFMCSITPRSSFSPSSGRPLPRERERRRRYKRHKVSDADDRHPIESSMTSQDSDMSISLDPLRDTLRRRRHHQEFDKRYRRMFDLNKHLQFVNSTNGLKGQKIASKKMHHLPPMNQKQYETLERSEMFAINTVTKTNDPEDKEVTPRTIWKNMAAGSTSTISTNADSAIDKSLSSFSKVSSSHTKSDMGKFDRLPEISTNSDKIAASNPDENDIYKETDRNQRRRF
ncbi:hypothetical protein FSP39_000925 [Pinctada imbricata]|uniref:Uncharacterized protein n=1 Tax=Pinctada imbricata TaxID=66713 RepID=A0AA88YGJ5_PINIB|nr:hypothetical protein FSP39_000925 [Pinctada imbricata]